MAHHLLKAPRPRAAERMAAKTMAAKTMAAKTMAAKTMTAKTMAAKTLAAKTPTTAAKMLPMAAVRVTMPMAAKAPPVLRSTAMAKTMEDA